MNNARLSIMFTAAIFLCASLGYCQGLSDQELKIYHDIGWEMLQAEYELGMDPTEEDGQKGEARIRQFLSQNNLTEEQLQSIIERGNEMPFTAAEEKLAQDLKVEMTDDLTADQIMAKLRELANRHGMSMGQTSSVFTRNIARD